MARAIWIGVICIIVGAGIAGAWRVWQYWLFYSALAELSELDGLGEALRPDSRHLAAIRKLRFTWIQWWESGGPIVDPVRPYGSRNMADDLAPLIGTRNIEAIGKFHIQVARGLSWALQNGVLPEGRYPLAHLDNAAMESAMMRGTEHLSEAQSRSSNPKCRGSTPIAASCSRQRIAPC